MRLATIKRGIDYIRVLVPQPQPGLPCINRTIEVEDRVQGSRDCCSSASDIELSSYLLILAQPCDFRHLSQYPLLDPPF